MLGPRRIFDVHIPRVHGARAKRVTPLPARLYSPKAPAPEPHPKAPVQTYLQKTFEPPVRELAKSKSKRSYAKMSFVYAGAAVLLFVVGAGASFLSWRTNNKVQGQVAHAITGNVGQEEASGLPAESEPSDNALASHKVAPDLPRLITIPSLEVSARVLRMGVKPSGELKTPNNVFDTGWYESSAKPGENGAMLIDGHVHGVSKPGVFYKLKKLAPGDAITVERGDGKILHYSVVKSRVYAANDVDMAAAVSSASPDKPGLNLITCDGAYDDEGHYNQRLIVFAVQD